MTLTNKERFEEYSKEGRDTIIDMTNLTPKTRKKNLSYFSKEYTKIAVAFPILSDEEYIEKKLIKKLLMKKVQMMSNY